jgi:carbamoyl-phosphate synthase large subunit
LITSAGRRVGLLNAARESLAQLGLDWRIMAADAAPELSAACQLADSWRRVPPIASADYVGSLLDICRNDDVGLVIPTIDTELESLSQSEGEFAKAGIAINIGSSEFVRIARDKALTQRELASLGIDTPRTWAGPVSNPAELHFPVIAKPPGGSSSIGIVRYGSDEEFRRNPPHREDMIQELVQGPEYTINVFCDAAGSLRCAVPHRRIEVRGGEVSKGKTERRPELTAIAEKIAKLPGAKGVFCFQAILSERGPVGFELNARFGGGYPLAHRAGGTFVKWLLEEATGRPCTAADDWQDGLTFLRYDSEVFMP